MKATFSSCTSKICRKVPCYAKGQENGFLNCTEEDVKKLDVHLLDLLRKVESSLSGGLRFHGFVANICVIKYFFNDDF